MTTPRLRPSQQAMFERMSRSKTPELEAQLIGVGGCSVTILNHLVVMGLIEGVDHPTVIDRRWNIPAPAYQRKVTP